MKHLSILAFVVAIVSCASTADLGEDDADGGSLPGQEGDAAAPDAQACPVLCGSQGLCCNTGEECIRGACTKACATGIRCGGACCGADQVCVNDACATPTTPCEDSVDCAGSEYCEPTLGKCLPQPKASACAIKPKPVTLAPKLKWSFTSPTAQPQANQAISAPLVVDVVTNGQHTPAVFLTTSDLSGGGTSYVFGYLRRLNGVTGAEAWGANVDALAPTNQVEATFAPAVADLDGDHLVDVVAMGATGEIVAFDGNGALKWRSKKADGTPYVFPIVALNPSDNTTISSSTIAIADMDHDGKGETVFGGVVFDSKGVVVSGVGRERAGGTGRAVSSVVADVDGDGALDVVTGNAAYALTGNAMWSNAADPDGFPAIADLDGNGTPELVVATPADLRVLDAKSGAVRATLPLPLNGPGSPVIADFGGTGVPEIGLQMSCALAVFHFDGKSLTQNWIQTFTSCSGSLTATAFDFDGDGQVEVLAHDDCRITVLDGAKGTTRLSLAASHATWTEFVSIADVDGNGVADMLFSSNDTWGGDPSLGKDIHGICAYQPGEQPSHGLYVYSDPNEKWMRTRKVWNEQPYHITNIKSDGTLPKPELASWGPGGWNNYRVSAQGRGGANAPNLVVSLGAALTACPDHLRLTANVANQGTAGVPAGITVEFYLGAAPGTLVGTAQTTKPLLPGASETLTLDVPAPAQPATYSATVDPKDLVPECAKDDNTGMLQAASCTPPAR